MKRVEIEPIAPEEQMTAGECRRHYKAAMDKDQALQYLCESNGVNWEDMLDVVCGVRDTLPEPSCIIRLKREVAYSHLERFYRTKDLTAAQIANVQQLYQNGMTISAVSQQTNLSEYAVTKACAGVMRRPGTHKRRQKNERD